MPLPDVDQKLRELVEAVLAEDASAIDEMLRGNPGLASASFSTGATRQDAEAFLVPQIGQYIYRGDTALHFAAAGYKAAAAERLLAAGADVAVVNRRKASALHYAVSGVPGSGWWNPEAQASTIRTLVEAGAEIDAFDANGATPLYRAIRNRCSAAVRALLEGSADASLCNARGSSPISMARTTSGCGGSGSDLARAEQKEIVRLLESNLR